MSDHFDLFIEPLSDEIDSHDFYTRRRSSSPPSAGPNIESIVAALVPRPPTPVWPNGRSLDLEAIVNRVQWLQSLQRNKYGDYGEEMWPRGHTPPHIRAAHRQYREKANDWELRADMGTPPDDREYWNPKLHPIDLPEGDKRRTVTCSRFLSESPAQPTPNSCVQRILDSILRPSGSRQASIEGAEAFQNTGASYHELGNATPSARRDEAASQSWQHIISEGSFTDNKRRSGSEGALGTPPESHSPATPSIRKFEGLSNGRISYEEAVLHKSNEVQHFAQQATARTSEPSQTEAIAITPPEQDSARPDQRIVSRPNRRKRKRSHIQKADEMAFESAPTQSVVARRSKRRVRS